jgi:hypothetical protein
MVGLGLFVMDNIFYKNDRIYQIDDDSVVSVRKMFFSDLAYKFVENSSGYKTPLVVKNRFFGTVGEVTPDFVEFLKLKVYALHILPPKTFICLIDEDEVI